MCSCHLLQGHPPRLPTHILACSCLSCPSSFRCFSSLDVFTSDIAPVWSSCLKSYFSCVLFPSVWTQIPYVVLFLRLIITKGDIAPPPQAVPDLVPAPLLLHPHLPPLLHCSPYFRNRDCVQSSEMLCSFTPWAFGHDFPKSLPQWFSTRGSLPPWEMLLDVWRYLFVITSGGCYCHLVVGDQGCMNSLPRQRVIWPKWHYCQGRETLPFYVASSVISAFQLWRRHFLLWQTALDPFSCGLGEVSLHCVMKMPYLCTSIITAQVMYYYYFILFLVKAMTQAPKLSQSDAKSHTLDGKQSQQVVQLSPLRCR